MASSNSALREMQQIAANAQIEVQRLSNEATEKSFRYNSEEANTARTWQKMMSDTSHQREVADLKAAGLNPVLSSGGSGAQSYTTSSANAQAENAAGSYASILGSQLSATSGIHQADISAKATRAAAAQSAAAMKQAAAVQASAARYAAAMNFASQKYHSDKAYQATKYQSDIKKEIAFKGPTGNPVKMLDKYFGSSASQNGEMPLLNKIKGFFNSDFKSFKKDPSQFLTQTGGFNSAGYRLARQRLAAIGVSTSKKNCDLYNKAIVQNNRSALAQLMNQTAITKIRQSQAMTRLTRSWKSSI